MTSEKPKSFPKRRAQKTEPAWIIPTSMVATVIAPFLLAGVIFFLANASTIHRMESGDSSGMIIAMAVLFGLIIAILTGQAARIQAESTIKVTATLVGGLFSYLMLFALIYLSLGATAGNFTGGVDRLGAVYYALGVFTTAGTGTIAPVSDTARLVTSLQMVTDLVYLLIGVNVVAQRWMPGAYHATQTKYLSKHTNKLQ